MQTDLIIAGRAVPAVSGRRFTTFDPSFETPIAEVARGGAADVDAAVRSAHEALHGAWAKVTPAQRGRLLLRLADLVLANKEELAALETADVGKPLKESRGDVDGVVSTLIYNAGAADKMEGTTIPLGPDVVDFTLLEPLGVTAHIVPWNYPLGMAARSVAPALAAGCTAVLKPAEQSPLSALRFAELALEAGIPAGVLNVVTGYGEEAGAPLVQHPLVRGVTFTGSVPTGRAIMAMAAARTIPVVLELGGKNAVLVFADADLRRLAEDLADAAFGNSGQICSSASKILVEESIAERAVELIRDRAARITVGPGKEDRDLGPVVSDEQHAKVMGYIEGAKDASRLVLGGRRPAGLEKGWFVAPTIFDRVPAESRIAREEVFGPVLTVTSFRNEEQALAIANGTGYGLAAGVYTQDISRALRVTKALEAGTVWVNGWFIGGQQAPTGGIKDSGIGRERGLPGVRNYLQIKNVGIRL
ncbi:MAG: aldehyde dehydrogenase family protein [Geminicoccaceae bacterium]